MIVPADIFSLVITYLGAKNAIPLKICSHTMDNIIKRLICFRKTYEYGEISDQFTDNEMVPYDHLIFIVDMQEYNLNKKAYKVCDIIDFTYKNIKNGKRYKSITMIYKNYMYDIIFVPNYNTESIVIYQTDYRADMLLVGSKSVETVTFISDRGCMNTPVSVICPSVNLIYINIKNKVTIETLHIICPFIKNIHVDIIIRYCVYYNINTPNISYKQNNDWYIITDELSSWRSCWKVCMYNKIVLRNKCHIFGISSPMVDDNTLFIYKCNSFDSISDMADTFWSDMEDVLVKNNMIESLTKK